MPGDVAKGKQLFQKHCVNCHGSSGDGAGWAAKEFGIKPADLRKISKNSNNYVIVVQMKKGSKNMPAWQDHLTPDELVDLSRYVLGEIAKGE